MLSWLSYNNPVIIPHIFPLTLIVVIIPILDLWWVGKIIFWRFLIYKALYPLTWPVIDAISLNMFRVFLFAIIILFFVFWLVYVSLSVQSRCIIDYRAQLGINLVFDIQHLFFSMYSLVWAFITGQLFASLLYLPTCSINIIQEWVNIYFNNDQKIFCSFF